VGVLSLLVLLYQVFGWVSLVGIVFFGFLVLGIWLTFWFGGCMVGFPSLVGFFLFALIGLYFACGAVCGVR